MLSSQVMTCVTTTFGILLFVRFIYTHKDLEDIHNAAFYFCLFFTSLLKSRANQVFENPGFSSSSEEFASPIPNAQNQMNPNHQFSPTSHNLPLNNPYFGRRSQGIPNAYASSPQLNQGGRFRSRADPQGNIFILPRQLDVGLCHNCQHLYGGSPTQNQVSCGVGNFNVKQCTKWSEST